ncbi:hypothetical protein NMY22_g4877 [Coprinellus aureogranulatus]|nr:hypothetical protein NMY22_g4877 [Coprinellus aureogranulatus]
MDFTDLVFFGEREAQNRGPTRDAEGWSSLLRLPSPIPYITSTVHAVFDACDHARVFWNHEGDTANRAELASLEDRPLLVTITDAPSGSNSDIALVECQCCFTEHDIASIIFCPADHPFCIQCLSMHASTQLGNGNTDFLCMDTSECNLPFHESDHLRFLSLKLVALRNRLIMRHDLEAANLDSFEECPFCNWGCIIEIPVDSEPLFWCGDGENGCGVVSCRKCKKKGHSPRPCEEDEGNKKERLVVEEAMSKALVRNCPKCSKGFVKEGGCNKMTCPSCGTVSCYLCRQIIKNGYQHFSESTPAKAGSSSKKIRCTIHDAIPLDQLHAQEVQRAEDAAKSQHRQTQNLGTRNTGKHFLMALPFDGNHWQSMGHDDPRADSTRSVLQQESDPFVVKREDDAVNAAPKGIFNWTVSLQVRGNGKAVAVESSSSTKYEGESISDANEYRFNQSVGAATYGRRSGLYKHFSEPGPSHPTDTSINAPPSPIEPLQGAQRERPVHAPTTTPPTPVRVAWRTEVVVPMQLKAPVVAYGPVYARLYNELS